MSYEYEVDVDDGDIAAATADLPNFRLGGEQYDEYDQYEASQQDYVNIPEVIKSFIIYFQRNLYEGNVYDVHSIYENSFNKLTEKYYKQSPWPAPEAVSPLINDDSLFLVLYKELYYRHIYNKLTPTLEHRYESYKNYQDLFDMFLSGDLSVELPSQWLWDMVDEYIYQFQAFCQYRAKLKTKTADEIAYLRENPQVWSVHGVLNTLQSVIQQSKILDVLKQDTNDVENVDVGTSNTLKMLGYFCIVGLCRVNSLLGDYDLALRVLEPIKPNKKQGIFTRISACYITLFYYMGFAYMMSRRYTDAIRTFSNILMYIQRTKQYHTRSYQYEQILKKNEQMLALLAICLSVCPQRIDESISAHLREKYAEKMQRMQHGEEAVFEECFVYSCPKFVIPSAPNYDDPQNTNQEAYRLQIKIFLQEMRQQQHLPALRSFLKLYTSIETSKLSDFMSMEKESLVSNLLCLKHKTRMLTWADGKAPFDGEWQSVGDVDYYCVNEMINIQDASPSAGKGSIKYGEYFINHINKFERIITDIKKSKSTQEGDANANE